MEELYEQEYIMARNALEKMQKAILKEDYESVKKNKEIYEINSSKLASDPNASRYCELLDQFKERIKYGLTLEDSDMKYQTIIIPRLNQLCVDYARILYLGISQNEQEQFNKDFQSLYLEAKEVLKFYTNSELKNNAMEDILSLKIRIESNPSLYLNGISKGKTK